MFSIKQGESEAWLWEEIVKSTGKTVIKKFDIRGKVCFHVCFQWMKQLSSNSVNEILGLQTHVNNILRSVITVNWYQK